MAFGFTTADWSAGGIPKIKDQYIELSHDDLRLLLDGIDIEKLKRFPELHFSVVG